MVSSLATGGAMAKGLDVRRDKDVGEVLGCDDDDGSLLIHFTKRALKNLRIQCTRKQMSGDARVTKRGLVTCC